MKFHWLKRLLEKVPPGVSISLPGVSIDPGSLAQYFADEDSAHKSEIVEELTKLRNNVGGGFQELKNDLKTRGIDTQEKFDELLKAFQVYANTRLISDVALPPNYEDYLKSLISDLSEWQKRYAPMFAKFKSLTLFARVTKKENKLNPQELIELIHKNKSLVIIGPAGAGKTTTLKKVALDNASNFLKQKRNNYVPIIVPLRDYGAVDLKAIISSIIKPSKLTLENIEQDLIIGKFIIIFDGLNEVSSKFRQQCFQEIRNFSREYSSNRFLFTSRSFEYHDEWVSIDDEKPIPVCEIDPLARGQVEDCIRRYFGARKKLADQLIDQLKIHDSRVWENSRSLARLATTPLLLQMLILTFEEKKGRIPKSEGELVLGFVDEILLKIEPKKSAAEINPEVKKALLATVAWKMHEEELSSIDKRHALSVFLKRLNELKQSGKATISYDANHIWQELQNNYLIIDDGNIVYWPHPLYQEMFIGLSLRESCFEDNWTPKFREIYVNFHSIETKWYGDPSFEAGLRMLEVIPRPHRLNGLTVIAMVNPPLAKEALMMFEPEHNPGMMAEFSETLKRDLLSSKWEGECHRNLLLTASYISHDYFCSLFVDCAALCPSWEGREQSAIFLWSRCEKTLALGVLKNLCKNDSETRVRKTAFNVLIQSEEKPNKEMCSFLVQRLFEENQGFLSDPQLLLQKLLDSELVVTLLLELASKENNSKEKLRAIWCLGESKINNVMARKKLIELSRKNTDEEIRRESVNALGSYPSDLTIKVLGNLANTDQAKLVRINAINSLYAMSSAKVLSSIVSALYDNENGVVEKAVATLVELSKKDKRVVNTLLRNLKQAKSKSKILLTLSRIAIKETDPEIRKKICKELSYFKNERDRYVRLEMALALRSYDLSLSNEIMRELSNDSDKEIRESAQAVLGDWGIEL